MKPVLSYELLDFTKRGFVVVVAEDLMQAIARYNQEFKNELEVPKHIEQMTALCIARPNGACILLFKIDQLSASTICHEVAHATNFMLSRIGVKLTNSTDEVYAYHNDMLFRKVAELLRQHNIQIPLLPNERG